MVKHEDETPKKREENVTLNPGILSVASTPEEQKAYFKEAQTVKDEVGAYEKKKQDEMVEAMRAAGTLPPVVNPDSKLPHIVSEKHGQIAPPNQNPTARCTVCGDPLAVGQNFVCVAHVRAG